MEPLEIQNAYHAFIKEHKESVTALLKSTYDKFSEHPKSSVLWSTDFSGFIGLPLFIISLIWIISAKSFNFWLMAATLIAFGFWLRFYQKHIIEISCRYFFNYGKGKIVLDEYISTCKHTALLGAPESEHNKILALYEYIQSSLWPDDFNYYKQKKN